MVPLDWCRWSALCRYQPPVQPGDNSVPEFRFRSRGVEQCVIVAITNAPQTARIEFRRNEIAEGIGRLAYRPGGLYRGPVLDGLLD